MKTDKTDNELIAEFMGWPKATKGYMVPNLYPFVGYSSGEIECLDTEMEFHRRFDWLMPVVEKIGKLYESAFPTGDEFMKRILAHEDPIDKEYVDVISTSICTPINEVYDQVIKFIKWYNSKDL